MEIIVFFLLRIGQNSIKKFNRRIEQLGRDKFPQFEQYGKMTFFIPVDSAFRVSSVLVLVILSHSVVMVSGPEGWHCGRGGGEGSHSAGRLALHQTSAQEGKFPAHPAVQLLQALLRPPCDGQDRHEEQW